MSNIFDKSFVLIYYVCQVIFDLSTIPSTNKIVTKGVFLGIFTYLFSTLFISSYYISDDG